MTQTRECPMCKTQMLKAPGFSTLGRGHSYAITFTCPNANCRNYFSEAKPLKPASRKHEYRAYAKWRRSEDARLRMERELKNAEANV